MQDFQIQIVDFDSVLQKKSIELRTKVLRKPLGLTYTLQQLADEKNEVHIVAIQNENVIGVLLLKSKDDEILKMRQVAVDPNFQNFGIGKKLVVFSEHYAIQNYYKTIVLHARNSAKDFYLKLNYKIVGDMFIEVGIPHFLMIKKLY